MPYIDVRKQIFCLSNIFILDFSHRPNKLDLYSWYGFLHLEGNKPNCGRNSLSETDGNKKAKKLQQTNKEFDLLPRMLFCDCYLIQSICNIFISTAGCFPPLCTLPCHETHPPLRKRRRTKYWRKNLINSKYINIKTRWMKKGLSDGFELWVLPSFIFKLIEWNKDSSIQNCRW